jgi:hypothetical protein
MVRRGDMHIPVLVHDPVPLRPEAAVDHRADARRLFPQFADPRFFLADHTVTFYLSNDIKP